MLYDKKRRNLIMMTDCYNLGHQKMKQNTDFELSHIYNREKNMLLFGFSDNINYFFREPITQEDLDEAFEYSIKVGILMPYKLFQRVIDECNGYPPLTIVSLPEGTWVPKGTPFAQIWNTKPGFGALVTWWEPLLLWAFFPSCCATRSLQIYKYNQDTTANFPRFHSFGFRALGDEDRAIQASTAWALFNSSSDDFHVARYLPIKTIPAMAHHIVQNWDDEMECIKKIIDNTELLSTSPFPAVSILIDTYGSEKFINTKVIELIKYARKKNIYTIFRPDSGTVLKYSKKILTLAKQNNLLDNCGTIIGDSVTFDSAVEGDKFFLKNGIDLHKIVWGIGAGYYKDFDRDYLGWAMKTAYSNGADRMKFSDTPMKESIPGKVQIVEDHNGGSLALVLTTADPKDDKVPNGYEVVYTYQDLFRSPALYIPSLEEVKTRALKEIPYMYKKILILDHKIKNKKEKLRKRYNPIVF